MKNNKLKTVHQVIKSCKTGDIITDGLRKWKVVESHKEGGDCVIASPYNWDKKTMGKQFEIWDDAQAKISVIPNLTVSNFTE